MHCGDPKCGACNMMAGYATPDPYYEKIYNRPVSSRDLDGIMIRAMLDDALKVSLASALRSAPVRETSTKKPEEKSMTYGDLQRVTDELRRLHKEGADLDSISAEIKNIQNQAKAETADALQGVAKAATLGKPKGQRFVLAYWKDGEARTLEGVDYARGKYIKEEDESKESRVYVHGSDFSITDKFYSVEHLKKALNGRNIVHVIDYFDKA